MALGSAAVLAVYAAGFARTRSAAAQLDARSDARRPPASEPATPVSIPVVGTADSTRNTPAAGATELRTESVADRAETARPPSSVPPQDPDMSVAVSTTSATPSLTGAAPADSITLSPPAITMAAPPADSARPADTARPAGIRDGMYTGWGTSRHGDIEATVVIEQGKITGAIISRCLTRYSCSWVAHLQQQVVARQSPEVDNVSGATQSANAFYYAVLDALAKAK
jgi:uncharacterized protein with FMN-binding domain